jgi:hypothetical protein
VLLGAGGATWRVYYLVCHRGYCYSLAYLTCYNTPPYAPCHLAWGHDNMVSSLSNSSGQNKFICM